MTADEVDFVLDAIKNNAGKVGVAVTGTISVGGSLSDIPLERIDRDNSDLLDDTPVHQMGAELEEMNYVGAASTTRDDRPLGASYDLQTSRVVSVRLMGAHASEYGAIDPQKGTADERSRDYPTTTWSGLKKVVRRAILYERKFPDAGDSTVAFKDLFVENISDVSRNYGDFYRWDADVRLEGFETLPG